MSVMCQGCGTELATWTGKCPQCGATATLELKKRADPMLGKVVGGRYKITKKLGQGGMGAVYQAEHTGVGQRVAIKFLNQAFSGDPDIARRFLNEAKSYGQITHPNAVHLHDFGQDEDGNLYISMEYIEGADLKKTLEKEKRLKLRDAVDVVLQVTEVLGHAHAKGIVHRDMKPENIMMIKGLRGYHAKVLDFGVARLMEEQGTRLTAAGSICGTPRYMSPEQAQGGDVNQTTDIYALGLVLLECVTGKHPFNGQSIAEILRKQVMEPTPHLSEIAPELRLPDALDDVIQRATAKDSHERFQSMQEMGEALASAIPTDASLEAYDVNTDPGLQNAQTMMKGEAVKLEKTAHKASPYSRDAGAGSKKSPAVIIGAAVGAALLVGGGIFFATRSSAPEQKVAVVEPVQKPEKIDGPAPEPKKDPAPEVKVAKADPAPEPKHVVESPTGTGTPGGDSANTALFVTLHTNLLAGAKNEFLAGRLDTSRAQLKNIPADSPIASQVQELEKEIEDVEGLMNRAAAAYRGGNCDQAMKLYGEALHKNKGMSDASAGIARCKREMPAATLE